MTQALDTVIAKLARLPADEQDRIAKWLAAELASEDRWNKLFDESRDVLGDMADEALKDLEAGRTREIDPDAHLLRARDPGLSCGRRPGRPD